MRISVVIVLAIAAGCGGSAAIRPGHPLPRTIGPAAAMGPRAPCFASTEGTDASGCVREGPQEPAFFEDRAGETPSSVGALVRPTAPGLQRCTATLVAPSLVITASHCLAWFERVQGGSCADAWFVLPAVDGRASEWIGCAGVVYATPLVAEDALEPDVALLRLSRASTRAPMAVAARPLDEGAIVSVASVTPHPIFASAHRRSTRLCRVLDPARAIAALGQAAAAVGWLESCDIQPGNSGSPVIDADHVQRAIVHGGSNGAFGVTTALTSEVVRALERAR